MVFNIFEKIFIDTIFYVFILLNSPIGIVVDASITEINFFFLRLGFIFLDYSKESFVYL